MWDAVFDRLEKILEAILEALSIPLKVALFLLNMLVLLVCFSTIGYYGYYPIIAILAAEMPIAYVILKEFWRSAHLLPKHEGFESNSEQMENAILCENRQATKRLMQAFAVNFFVDTRERHCC